MKKFSAVLMALFLIAAAAVPAFAEDTKGDILLFPETAVEDQVPEGGTPAAELPFEEVQTTAADAVTEQGWQNPATGGFDLMLQQDTAIQAFRQCVQAGIRLFDMPGYLSKDSYNDISSRLDAIRQTYHQDAAVIMVYGRPSGMDMETYADQLYAKGGFGEGSDRDGSLLVIDYLNGEYRIYAQGGAMRYFTDSAIEQIGKSRNGGIEEPLSNWNDYEALLRYTKSVNELYAQGIQQNQVNYDPVTGQSDPAYPQQKKPFIRLWQVIVSLVISLIAGLVPVSNVKRQYAMEAEKRAAQGLNLAYRMTAGYVYNTLMQDRLVDKQVVRRLLPHQESGGGRPGGGVPFGGGQSTMRPSSGGGSHTSGGGSFKGR